MAEGIDQPPAHQSLHPFAFFRKERAFSGTQPALTVLFANANIQVARTDIHITHNQHRIFTLEFGFQVVLQILIKLRLCREFYRMVAAFTLREVTVDHGNIAQRRGDFSHNNSPLRLFVITRKTATHGNRRLFGQQRHAIMAFLPVIKHVVAELRHLFEWKHIVMNFCLLQANHIRLVLFDDGFKLMRSGAQAVDIKRDKFHSRCHLFR